MALLRARLSVGSLAVSRHAVSLRVDLEIRIVGAIIVLAALFVPSCEEEDDDDQQRRDDDSEKKVKRPARFARGEVLAPDLAGVAGGNAVDDTRQQVLHE